MTLVRLRIRNLRNIQSLDLNPASGINVMVGPNASGKSSLLEAVHLLSCGRSFRTPQVSQIVSRGSDGMTLSAEVYGENDGNITLGMVSEGSGGRLNVRAGGSAVKRLSELAVYLPTISIHQDSHRVLTQGPEFRRSFLDWGLFHVEPQFLPAWQRYRRALRQRNLMLQQSSGRPDIWDRDLVDSAVIIDAQRRRYLQHFESAFQALLPMLQIDTPVTISYRSGWGVELEFAAQLAKALAGDRRFGYTRFGPHRADIDFLAGGVLAREILSRGQMKVLIYALMLAQACVLAEATGRRGLIMMDDLAAELDSHCIGQLVERIASLGFQSIITSSDPRFRGYLEQVDHRMFHVEHGRFMEVL
jgi:DNA replication and repair protein RecF